MVMSSSPASYLQPRDLGNGLLLRWSRAEDAEDLAYLECMVFLNQPADPLQQPLAYHVRELMSGTHPLMGSDGFALVEDTRRRERRVVAAASLFRQQLEYEGLLLPVGRPELVVSDPDYRNQGLIRAIFALLHARSEAEGDLLQAITGIPYFYRQFGYEYALELDGALSFPVALIPLRQEGSEEPVLLRAASLEDLPAMRALYDRRRREQPISTVIPERWWRYHLEQAPSSRTGEHWDLQVITDQAQRFLGFLMMPTMRWTSLVPVLYLFETEASLNLYAAMPALLRALLARGQQMAVRRDPAAIDQILFALGGRHAVYDVLQSLQLGPETPVVPRISPPYAWYVRVPDLPRLLRRLAPLLERRLAASALASYSGEFHLSFFRGGLHLVFTEGELSVAESWQQPFWRDSADGWFPPGVFLQLLFGYRSLDELRQAFPDVFVTKRTELLLQALFPKRPSWVVPLG